MNIRLPKIPKPLVIVLVYYLLQVLLNASLSLSIASVVAGLALEVLTVTARHPQPQPPRTLGKNGLLLTSPGDYQAHLGGHTAQSWVKREGVPAWSLALVGAEDEGLRLLGLTLYW